MSRCFPFPPPGYEKKTRTDNPDLLRKEKQSAKKHKKEKKDKEKRESKERKEKDSDEKHREKKDKKEKNREKKEKDKDKDREKNSNSDEKKLAGKPEGHDAEKTSHEKKLPTKSESHNGENFIQKKERDKDITSISREKKVAGQFSGYSEEKPSQNCDPAGDSKDSVFPLELGRVRAEERGIGNQLVEKFIGTDENRNEGMVRLVAKATGSLAEGKEKKKDKSGGNDRKPDEQGNRDEARFTGNDVVQSLSGIVHKRAEGMPRPLSKDVDSKSEGREKTKQKERVNKHGDKRKDKDREKKVQGKDKDRDKNKKEKEKMKSEHKNTEKDLLKDGNKDELIGTHDGKTLHLPKDSDKNAVSEGNSKKRKHIETNGFCHANDIRPNKLPRPMSSSNQLTETDKLPRPTSSSRTLTETNKLPRPTSSFCTLTETNKLPRSTSSSHTLTETSKLPRPISSSHSSSHPLTGNGKVLESCHTTSDRQGTVNNPKADNKEQTVNGIVVSQPLPVSISKPSYMTAQADQIAEVSKKPPHPIEVSTKPPHPDTKYLDQVLSVPNEEELSDYDDQEWLFHGSDLQSKKPMMGSSGNDEMTKVWAEVMRIESADVYALPYVFPF